MALEPSNSSSLKQLALKGLNKNVCSANNRILSVFFRTNRECSVIMRSVASACVSVGLSCSGSNFWKSWATSLQTSFCCAGTFQNIHSVCQRRVSRSWGQGQGHTSVTKYTRSRVVCLRLKGNLVLSCFYVFVSAPQSEPEVEFQYAGCLFFETESSNISATYLDIEPKFGPHFDLLKQVTSPKSQSEVDFRRRFRIMDFI